ncbi:hypothetical protein U8607_24140 [Methylobacterium durans]|uniref:hypothetical protein n=1 Tax=Methylobacterium durans TaxID=2202825 RepID=UPI002AFFBC22|nr:hypothetical protein [Methylobacterium durans]MEA1835181.1 hypothetical protein [Methylobacterium durans]
MARDPTKLDYLEARRILIPDDFTSSPTLKSWKPWTRPAPSKAIDREIEKLIKRSIHGDPEPRMRAGDQLASIGIVCPYWHARHVTAVAAGEGVERVGMSEIARHVDAPRLKRQAEAAREAADKISSYLETLDAFWSVFSAEHRLFPAQRDDYTEINSNSSKLSCYTDHIKISERLIRELAEHHTKQKELIAPSNAPGKLWEQAFVEGLGYAWRDLTGRNPPKNGGRFLDFVEAAFDSLGEWNGPAKSWTTQINTVCNRVEKQRPEWDRWDRRERGIGRPGEAVMSFSDVRERWERMGIRLRLASTSDKLATKPLPFPDP